MMYISANSDDGINHLALARKVNIDRKNLTPYMKRLMMKGLVIRGDGKRGKYYPATKKNRGISVTADIFSGVGAGTILEFDRNFPIDSPYFKSEIIDDKYSLENALFMFSNGVGSIITYLLIQSMNQSYNIPGKGAKSDEEKDINVRRWFSDAMSTLGVILLTLFKQDMATPLIISHNNYIKKDGKPDFYRVERIF